MRPVLLIRNTAPENFGGGETYQIKLAKLFLQHDIEPIIISSSKKLLADAKSNKIKAIHSPYLKRQNWSGIYNLLLPIYLVKIVWIYRWYKKLFKELSPSAINIQSRDDWIAATLAASRLGNIKIIWTDHMDFRSWVLTNVERKFKNPIGKYILRLSKIPDKIITISDFEYRFARRYIKTNNLCVIKNGAIDQKHQFDSIVAASQSICYVGRIIDYKGVNELLEAFLKIQPKFPDAKLEIYGTGPNLNEYRSKYEPLGKGMITFHSYTNEPLRAMANSEIFILPSYREGLSLSLLDAAMMGKTIIATSIDGNPEIVIDKRTGLLVPARDSLAIANALTTLIQNKELGIKLANSARRHFEQHFNFERIFVHQILPLYQTKPAIKPSTPLISIIVPIYNIAQYLQPCLESIQNQTYSNLEIILVDDGSTDDSARVYQPFLQDSRFKLIKQANAGLSAARNAGLKLASGELISFIDGDDAVAGTFIENLYHALITSTADIAVCDFEIVEKAPTSKNNASQNSYNLHNVAAKPHQQDQTPALTVQSGIQATIQLLTKQENYDIVTWNKLYKKALFIDNSIEFPVGKIHEDSLTTYKLYARAQKVAFTNAKLYYYVQRSNSIMNTSKLTHSLEMRILAAEEATKYLSKNRSLKAASQISELLARLAVLDKMASGAIEEDQALWRTTISWIVKHKKQLQNNPHLTPKLSGYLCLILFSPNAFAYRLFRKCVH